MQLKAEFDVTGWDQQSYHETEGPILSRVTVRKTFKGDLEAESSAELLMCQADPEDYSKGAGYVASEHVTGKLNGRSGSFVMQHGAVMGPDVDESSISGRIVPGSGVGELAGLGGTVEITQTKEGHHRIALEVEFKDRQ